MRSEHGQCKATTAKGPRCLRWGWFVGGFCHTHADQAEPQYRPFTPEWWAYHRARRFDAEPPEARA